MATGDIAGYSKDGKPIYWGEDGGYTFDPPPGTDMLDAGVAPAKAPYVNPAVAAGLQIPGQSQSQGLSTDAMIDQLLEQIISQQFPTRYQSLLGAINPAQAQANGSPMAISRAAAPQLAGLQSGIQGVLKNTSRQLGPSGGGLLKLGREAGLLPIQKQAAAIPGQVRQQGQQSLLDIATNTSILNPSAAKSSSGSSSSTMTQQQPYDYTGWNMLGSGLGTLAGSPAGSAFGNWMWPQTVPGAQPAPSTMPTPGYATPSGYYNY